MKQSAEKPSKRHLSRQGDILAEYNKGKTTPPALKWWLGEYEAEQELDAKQGAKTTKAPAKAPAKA